MTEQKNVFLTCATQPLEKKERRVKEQADKYAIIDRMEQKTEGGK
jgi:hypothetical protein